MASRRITCTLEHLEPLKPAQKRASFSSKAQRPENRRQDAQPRTQGPGRIAQDAERGRIDHGPMAQDPYRAEASTRHVNPTHQSCASVRASTRVTCKVQWAPSRGPTQRTPSSKSCPNCSCLRSRSQEGSSLSTVRLSGAGLSMRRLRRAAASSSSPIRVKATAIWRPW